MVNERVNAAHLLQELRDADDGWCITVWHDANGDEPRPGWKVWSKLDAKYAEGERGWLMTIDLADVVEMIRASNQSDLLKGTLVLKFNPDGTITVNGQR